MIPEINPPVTASGVERMAYRPSEVADAIGSSEQTIYRMIRTGAIPSFCIGSDIRVSVEALRVCVRAWNAGESFGSTKPPRIRRKQRRQCDWLLLQHSW
jgi:excisionase family DNA binding protein